MRSLRKCACFSRSVVLQVGAGRDCDIGLTRRARVNFQADAWTMAFCFGHQIWVGGKTGVDGLVFCS